VFFRRHAPASANGRGVKGLVQLGLEAWAPAWR
jgi:hypothetical protein